MDRKKRILYQSDYSLAKTGFGRCAKALLTYLYKTGKYDICHYSCGFKYSEPQLQRTPWISRGTLPDDPAEFKRVSEDPTLSKFASYGATEIDTVIKEFKPDVYIAAQDIWGIDFALQKPWFNEIKDNVALWTTLDSLPILPTAITAAKKANNFWIWSDFATKALKNMGYHHVKTLHGPVDTNFFGRLPDHIRREIRRRQNIDTDKFIVGYVFRNQLRKSVPNLLEGYALWKKQTKQSNSALLLHTSFKEGWDIPKLAKEYNIPLDEILTTFVCRSCLNYQVKPIEVSNGQVEDLDCPWCGDKKSSITTGVGLGITEHQLNDIYNLMDVYCHPFTSGGQEYPIQEAKLAELITLVTNYSCGEEMCEEGAASLPLDWHEYREHGTQFIKASTDVRSIAKQLRKVSSMKPEKKRQMEVQARKWAIENYAIEKIGKKIEDFCDSRKNLNWDEIKIEQEQQNPDYVMPEIHDDSEWLIHAYHNILTMKHVDENDDGYKHWMNLMDKGMTREQVEENLRKVALQQSGGKKVEFEEFLDKDDKGKRILYAMPEGPTDILLSTALFKSIKEQYPDYNLYVATNKNNLELLHGNEYVHKTIPFIPAMDNTLWSEGVYKHEGYFEVAYSPYQSTKMRLDYLHNGKDNIALNLNY